MKRFALLLALLSSAAMISAQDYPVVDKVVAVVGKNIVKLSDVENNFASVRMRQGYNDAQMNRCNILETLLISKLLVHKGEVDSVEVTDDEINANVEYYLQAYESQYGSKEAIRQATGYTYDELKQLLGKMLRERMLTERVRSQLTSSVKITPAEVTESPPTVCLPYRQPTRLPKLSSNPRFLKRSANGCAWS